MHPLLASEHRPRHHRRHELGTFVAADPAGADSEGFLAVELSRGGMSLLRLARGPRHAAAPGRALDRPYAWISVPVHDRGRRLSAVIECVHRRRVGPLESLGVKFLYLAPDEQAELDAYLARRERAAG